MKIVVRGTNWIGDAVMTIPAIRRLRDLFPGAKLSLLAPPLTASLFRGSTIFDDVVEAGSLLAQVRHLRKSRFDLAVIFPNSFKSALALRLGGVVRRTGYATDGRSMLLTDAVPVPVWKDHRHETLYYLHLVETAGESTSPVSPDEVTEPRIDIATAELDRANELLERRGVERENPLVVVAPGSTNSRAKRWTAESFAEVCDRLRRDLAASVVLMGSSGDATVSRRVRELAGENITDITGETDVSTAAAILERADLLISNDMGLAHLAPAVGTETIVIFGPTNPVTTRPYSRKATVMTASVECSPCMLRDCPIDHRCMTRITPDAVFDQARRVLQNERC